MAGADPAWTDATRNAIYRRKGYLIGLRRQLAALARFLHPQNARYLPRLVHGAETASVSALIWSLTAGRIRTDTDVNGVVYGSIVDETPGANQATINLYNDSGRSVLVSTGSGNNGATITLTAQSGYYLAGTVKIGTITANASFSFLLIPPAYARAAVEFDGTEEDDAQNLNAAQDAILAAREACLSGAAAIEGALGEVQRTLVRRRMVVVSSEDTLLDPGLEETDGGQIDESPFGLLEDERLAQAANTGGSAEIKAGAATQSGSPAYGGSWTGRTNTSTLGKMSLAGTWTWRCVKGLDASGAPEFEGFFDPDDNRRKPNLGRSAIPTSNRLTLGKTWKEPQLGIEALNIEYSPTITNSSGTSLSATATDWLMPEGLTSENSDAGTLYTFYEASDTTLEFYKTSSGRDAQDADDLVTEATLATSAVNTVFTTQDTGAGLTLTGKSGAGTAGALVDGNKGTVAYNAPVSTQPASFFTWAVTESVAASSWLQEVRDGAIGGARWEPNTGSSPNLDDGWIEGGMPFADAYTYGDV